MKHLSMFKTAAEINRLRELVNNQRETIKKSMQVVGQLTEENLRLQDENEKLKALVEFHKYMRTSPDDIIFPNTDPRGLTDTSNSEPEGLDNIY